MIHVQETAPQSPEFGDEWRIPSSGACYMLNPDGNAWLLRGNANYRNIGTLSVGGAEFDTEIRCIKENLIIPLGLNVSNGEIDTSDAYLDGYRLATVNDISSITQEIYEGITTKCEASTRALLMKGNDSICSTVGVLPFSEDGVFNSADQFTPRIMNKPRFKDGTEPVEDLTFTFYWPAEIKLPDVILDMGYSTTTITEASPLSRTINACYYIRSTYNEFGGVGHTTTTYYGLDLHYVSFGIR